MRKNILLLMMSLIYLGAYSQDYQISANGSQSVMACTTGDVYAWGCNGESSADGRLGVGNMSSSSIYRPTKVNMPAEAGKIQHVDGSSGAFLLAINCDGGTIHRTGSSSICHSYTTPRRYRCTRPSRNN